MSAARDLARSAWGGGWLWQGTPAELVGAGVVTAAQMAAAEAWRPPGRRPSIVLPGGQGGVIKRDPAHRGRWLVYVELSDDELAQRKRQAQALQHARGGADPVAARQSAEALLRAGVCTIAEAFNLGDHTRPYRFDAHSVASAARALRELVQAFGAGTLTATPAPRCGDAEFERFLQVALRGGGP